MKSLLKSVAVFLSKSKILLLLASATTLVLVFQNCRQFSTDQSNQTSSLNSESAAHISFNEASRSYIFQQSSSDSVANILFVNSLNPSGGFGVSQWFANPNGPSDVVVNWNVGDFTGFYPANKSTAQLGVSNASYGSTAVQAEGGTIGLMIHTQSAETATTNPATIFAIVPGANLNVYPFANPDQLLIYSMELQVFGAYNQAPGIGYAGQYFFFADHTSNKGFWYGNVVYDPRGMQEAVMFDGAYNGDTPGTSSPIILSVAGLQNAQYSTALDGAGIQTSTWTGFKKFTFAISPANLKNAIAAVKRQYPNQYSNLSDDPVNYYLTSFNFDPEIAKVNGGEGWLGLSFKNINISTVNATTPSPTPAPGTAPTAARSAARLAHQGIAAAPGCRLSGPRRRSCR